MTRLCRATSQSHSTISQKEASIKDHQAFHALLWASPVARCWRICQPVRGMQVQCLIREDPACQGAAKPVCHSMEPVPSSPGATAAEALCPRARALQPEKPLQWEAWAPHPESAPAAQRASAANIDIHSTIKKNISLLLHPLLPIVRHSSRMGTLNSLFPRVSVTEYLSPSQYGFHSSHDFRCGEPLHQLQG